MLYLTNGDESTFFFFESATFWNDNRSELAKYAIQLNFKERYDELESIGKGSFSVVKDL
jgi:hypothetical protein